MATRRVREFEENISRARELVGLGQAIAGLTVGRVDATDMYRSALVQGVASLDAYVHAAILDLAVEILFGRRPAGSASKVGLHVGIVSDILSAAPDAIEQELRARAHIAQRLGLETFQRPDDIAQAFAMVGFNKVWSVSFGRSAEQTKLALSVTVLRRNAIVHACDVDPGVPGGYRDMDATDAVSAISDISAIVAAIDSRL